MPLSIWGMNYKTAPLSLRERLTFTSDNIISSLHDLLREDYIKEAMVLSTCHRVELYTNSSQSSPVINWLAARYRLSKQQLLQHSYFYQGREMITHLMELGCGLQSMVLGESQIVRQIKQAFASAYQAGSAGQELSELLPQVLSASKKIRTHTDIGVHTLSLAYSALEFAQHIFTDISQCNILLIGAGETIQLVAKHLARSGYQQLWWANRTPSKVKRLLASCPGQAITLSEMTQYLPQVDILITATGSLPILIDNTMMQEAFAHRKHNPMFIADLSVPRDIDPQIGQRQDVYLYNVDDLNKVIAANSLRRQQAAQHARAMIQPLVDHYIERSHLAQTETLIKTYRQHVIDIREELLHKAQLKLRSSHADPEQIVTQLAHRLCNRIMHTPCTQWRKAAMKQQQHVCQAASYLLNIELSEQVDP